MKYILLILGGILLTETSTNIHDQFFTVNLSSNALMRFFDAVGVKREKLMLFCEYPEKYFRRMGWQLDLMLNKTIWHQSCTSYLSTHNSVSPVHHDTSNSTTDGNSSKSISKFVWLYTTLVTVVISCIGVAVILATHFFKRLSLDYFYNFTVALGIGCLLADSLLHLIPHAFLGHSDHDHDHDHHQNQTSSSLIAGDHFTGIMKGFTMLLGIQVFLIVERFMLLRRNAAKSEVKNTLFKKPFQIVRQRLARLISQDAIKKYHIVSYFAHQLKLTTCENPTNEANLPAASTDFRSINSFDSAQNKPEVVGNQEQQVCEGNLLNQSSEPPQTADVPYIYQNMDENIHSEPANHCFHDHSHIHIAASNASDVAYLLMVGEAVHKFADGLAIGAAFVENVASGFGTAIAVFCHELPHEIGNFTVLIKIGLSIKRALIFNCMSAFLSLIGSYVGILIGNISNFAPWIFCIIAGVFVYLALVDMLAQLAQENLRLKIFLFENLGYLFGIGLMLIIALFEEEIQSVIRL